MQCIGGEIAEETGMLPKRQARNDEAIQVLDRRGEIFRVVWRRGG